MNFFHDCFLYISYDMSEVNISKMKNNLCLVVASLLPKIIIIVKWRILQGNAEIQNFSSRVSDVLQVSTLNKI